MRDHLQKTVNLLAAEQRAITARIDGLNDRYDSITKAIAALADLGVEPNDDDVSESGDEDEEDERSPEFERFESLARQVVTAGRRLHEPPPPGTELAKTKPIVTNYEEVARICREAVANSLPMVRAVMDFYDCSDSTAKMRIKRARQHGADVPTGRPGGAAYLSQEQFEAGKVVPPKTIVDYAAVAKVAIEAYERGEAMGPAVAERFGLTQHAAEVRVITARQMGHPIPKGHNAARRRMEPLDANLDDDGDPGVVPTLPPGSMSYTTTGPKRGYALNDVARIAVEALEAGGSAIKTISEHYGISYVSAQARVKAARDAGFDIPAARSGRRPASRETAPRETPPERPIDKVAVGSHQSPLAEPISVEEARRIIGQ